jgi:SH3 domain protein
MIQKKLPILLAIICLATSAIAANNYVSDELYTYTHKGPGTKYKIMGVVNAGEKIKVLTRDTKAGYSQIKDAKGRKVWIDSKYVSNQPGLKEQLEKLRISDESSNKKISSLEEELNLNITKVQELEKTNKSLTTELAKIQELNDSLSTKVDNEKNELLMQWFSYGGMVAGLGLLFGLILPSLIPSRKRKSSW